MMGEELERELGVDTNEIILCMCAILQEYIRMTSKVLSDPQ